MELILCFSVLHLKFFCGYCSTLLKVNYKLVKVVYVMADRTHNNMTEIYSYIFIFNFTKKQYQ